VTNDPEVLVAEAGKDGEAGAIFRRPNTARRARADGLGKIGKRLPPQDGSQPPDVNAVLPTLTRCDQKGRNWIT
jgi:hypothetical protein